MILGGSKNCQRPTGQVARQRALKKAVDTAGQQLITQYLDFDKISELIDHHEFAKCQINNTFGVEKSKSVKPIIVHEKCLKMLKEIRVKNLAMESDMPKLLDYLHHPYSA